MDILKSKQVKKYIETQDVQTQKRLENAIANLPNSDVVPMIGFKDAFRLRVGSFRAIFVKDGENIKVTLLSTRGQAYKKGGK